jgi:hypothetical protein
LIEVADEAIRTFRGDSRKLGSAIGMLHIGRRLGWRPLLLMSDRTTMKEYEKILGGVNFREILPEEGPLAHRSFAWRSLRAMSDFWKAVRGQLAGARSPDLR